NDTNCDPGLHADPGRPASGGLTPHNSGLCRLAEVCFASSLDSRGNRILFTSRHVFAALDQFVGALTEFPRFALSVIFAFISSFGQVVASLFTGLRRKENSHECAYTQANQEITHLGTNIVRHSNLRKDRSIRKIAAQYELTGMFRS